MTFVTILTTFVCMLFGTPSLLFLYLYIISVLRAVSKHVVEMTLLVANYIMLLLHKLLHKICPNTSLK